MHHEDGAHHDSFLQCKGFAQGCPLSPILKCLVLALVTVPLNTELQHQTVQQQDLTSPSSSSSCLDDTGMLLCFLDLLWHLKHFSSLGAPLTIKLNLSETKILPLLTPQLPLSALSPTDHHCLQSASAFLQSSKQLQGICLLG